MTQEGWSESVFLKLIWFYCLYVWYTATYGLWLIINEVEITDVIVLNIDVYAYV